MKCHPKKEKEAEEVLVEENKIKGKDPKACTFFCSGSVFVGVFTKRRTLKCNGTPVPVATLGNSANLFKLYTVRHPNFKITGIGIKFVIP